MCILIILECYETYDTIISCRVAMLPGIVDQYARPSKEINAG